MALREARVYIPLPRGVWLFESLQQTLTVWQRRSLPCLEIARPFRLLT
jgi:hypothetical protein